MPPLLRRPACGHGLLAPSLPLPSCFPSTQPVARWGKRAENCPLKCGTKPGARPCHPAGGAAHPSHAARSCPCCWARFGGLLPSAWSSRARRCCEAHGDGLGAAREVICALGLSECRTEAGSAGYCPQGGTAPGHQHHAHRPGRCSLGAIGHQPDEGFYPLVPGGNNAPSLGSSSSWSARAQSPPASAPAGPCRGNRTRFFGRAWPR